MKRFTPTLFINISKVLSLLNFFFFSKKLIPILLTLTLYNISIFAQETDINSSSTSVLELKTFLANHKNEDQNDSSANQKIEDLIYKLQPSIYFYNGTVKIYGENPSNLFTDINSLNKLKDADMPKNHIKIVRISLKNAADLNSTIDLSVFSNFQNLKYIYIFSNIPITEQNLTGMILNPDKKYTIFYKIDRGESNQ